MAQCQALDECTERAKRRCPRCGLRVCNEHMVLAAVPHDVMLVGPAMGPYPVLLTHPEGQTWMTVKRSMQDGFIRGGPRCLVCRVRDGAGKSVPKPPVRSRGERVRDALLYGSATVVAVLVAREILRTPSEGVSAGAGQRDNGRPGTRPR